MINWKVRLKNPVFLAQIGLSILTPILAYVGMSFADITSWSTLGQLFVHAYSNPYLLGLVVVSVFNTVTDPTVEGLGDSTQAMTYVKPRKKKEDK